MSCIQGELFMESLRNNKPLLYSLAVSGGTIVGLASGLMPEATEYFELVPLPDEVGFSCVLTLFYKMVRLSSDNSIFKTFLNYKS